MPKSLDIDRNKTHIKIIEIYIHTVGISISLYFLEGKKMFLKECFNSQ